MPPDRQPLTLADLRSILDTCGASTDPAEVFAAVDGLAKRVIGHLACSIFCYLDATAEVERVYTSSPGSHPVGGRKRITDYPHNQAVLARGEIYVAPDREAIARTYKEPERIFALGVSSIMNVPVRRAGRNVGALNLFGEAGWYDDACHRSARTIAGLLTPTLMAMRATT